MLLIVTYTTFFIGWKKNGKRLLRITFKDWTLPKNVHKDLTYDEVVELFLAEVTIKGQSLQTKRWHSENLAAVRKVSSGHEAFPTSLKHPEKASSNNHSSTEA